MKKLIKCFTITISLLLIININVLADDKIPNANVQLIGDAKGIVFIDNNDYFLLAENMMPGDKISGKILLENKYDNSYDIYLRAERITAEEEYDLLNKINLIINDSNNIIYDGLASGNDGLEKDIKICSIKPGEKKNLSAFATLDGATTGNEYKNKVGEVKWIFTAVNNSEDVSTDNNLPDTGKNIIVILMQYIVPIVLIYIGKKKCSSK